MSARNRSFRRYRNGRQNVAKIQMIGSAATLFSHSSSGRPAGLANIRDATDTSLRKDLTTVVILEEPTAMMAMQQKNGHDDTTLPIEIDCVDTTASSVISSDGETDLLGLDDIDDEELHIRDNRSSSVKPLPASEKSKLVEDFELPALEFLSLCQEVNSPLYLYDELVAILKRHSKNGSLDVKKMPMRKTLMQNLRERLHPPIPYPHLIQTADGADIEVTKFNFLDQLRDLLQMSYFDHIDNLCANKEESQRFLQYRQTAQDELLEVCSCDWYKSTYEMLGVARQKKEDDGGMVDQFLMPLIFYVDKTGTDVFQRYPLEPLMFTTAILRRDIRRKADSWRHLGFIPPVKANDSRKALNNIQSYHYCLSVLLEDLVELQKHPPTLEVNLGGIRKVVSVRLPVAFVIGDQLSQDALCGKRPSSTIGTPRIHRSCMCSHLHCTVNGKANHLKHVGCKPIPIKAVQQLTLAVTCLPQLIDNEKHGLDTNEATREQPREIELHKAVMKRRAQLATKILNSTLGLYEIDNAFNPVCFGSNESGIHTATMNDIMHFNEGGLFLNLAQVAYGILPPKRRQENLETTIARIFSSNHSSVRSDYPRGFYKTGFSDLTLLTSVEKVGVVFALLVALRLDEDVKSNLFEKEIVESQKKYLTFPLGSDGHIKSEPDIKSENKANRSPATTKFTKGEKKGRTKVIATPKSTKGEKKGRTKVIATPKSTKGEKKCGSDDDKKRNAKHISSDDHLRSFPLTSASLFLRNKGKDKNEKTHYPLTVDGIRSIAHHLKLHDLGEILNVDLDALQLHYLLRSVWEVVSNLTDESYPSTPHEILSLNDDDADPESDDTGTVAVYAFLPPKENEREYDSDYRESHFRLTFIEMFGLEILKEQISALDMHIDNDLMSMYGIEREETPQDKRRRLSKSPTPRPRNHDEIQTKPNGDVVLLARSLREVANRKSDKNSQTTSTFVAKHGRDKKGTGLTTTRTCAVLSDVNTFCQMLEVTLLHHAYLHYSETLKVEERRDLSTFQRGIQSYMELVDRCMYRGDNSLDHATGKFHCHYQTVNVIPLYGDPSQYEAGSCERGLKTWAKKASHTAQKNKDVEVFSFQTASRVSDSQLLSNARDITLAAMAPAGGKSRSKNPWQQALTERSEQAENTRLEGNYFFARGEPNYHLDTNRLEITKVDRKGNEIVGSTTTMSESDIHKMVLYAVLNEEERENNISPTVQQHSGVIDLWTELKDGEGNYLRATPSYPSVGPWYDWVLVHFQRPTGVDVFLPAKCLIFYMDRSHNPSAIVHSVCWDPVRDKSGSLIFTEWQKEYNRNGLASMHKVPISAIQRGVYAFERCSHDKRDIPVSSQRLRRHEVIQEKVVVLAPRSTWASKFYEWCQTEVAFSSG